MSRPRLATVVLSGCTGCHLSLLDAHEGLIDLLAGVELVYSPLVDGDTFPGCDIALVEGAVGNERDERVLREVRERSKVLIAMGSCAVLGGIGGLRNLYPRSAVLAEAYGDDVPGDGLPALAPSVRAVSDVVETDVEIPGCSVPTQMLVDALTALLAGQPFVLPRRNLCAECTRTKRVLLEHGRDFVSDAVYSVMELERIDPARCFLEQGVICLGPVTREGCGSRCLAGNMPCRGCMGPPQRDFEQGAKMVDALAAILPAGAIMYLDDLVGTAYRYTLPVSYFPSLVTEEAGDE
ncbi:MAG TPA: F420-nonreducing hydrogenase [Coriobacteriia bacterium]